MKQIKFTQKLAWDFYLNTTFKIVYKKLLSTRLIFLIIFLLIIMYSLTTLNENFNYGLFVPVFSLLIIYYFVAYPILLYKSAKNIFNTAAAVKEQLSFTIDEERLIVNAESFDYSTKWSNMVQFHKIGDCLLMYANKTAAYYIDLNQIEAVDRIYFLDMIKHIANNHNHKHNLK